MADLNLKVGDTSPAITAICGFNDGTIQDLTGAAVTFAMRVMRSGVVKINDQPAAVIGSPSRGTVTYVWAPADTDTPGTYQCEFHVTLASGKKVTFPNAGYDYVVIEKRVAP